MEGPSKRETKTQSTTTRGWTEHIGKAVNDLDAMRYRILVEHGLGLICTHDLAGVLLSVNKAAANALGFAPASLVGRNGREMLPASVRAQFDSYLLRIRRDGIDEGFMRLATRGGEELIWLYRNVLYREADGREYVLGHAQDVTRLHRAQKETEVMREELETRVVQRTRELQEANNNLRIEAERHEATTAALGASETRQRALLDEVPDMIFRIRRDGTFLDFNPAHGVQPFAPPAEFLGKTLREMLPRDVSRPCMTAVRRVCETGRPETLEYKLPEGPEEKTFEARIFASGTEEVFGVVRDVTERNQAEAARRSSSERQQHQARLESLGALAGGIAHDFNNLLMSILGYTELARAELPEDHPAAIQIGQAITAATRASELTMQMLTFAGSGTTARSSLQLNTIIHDADLRFRELLSPGAELVYRLSDDLPSFLGEATYIRQALLCVVANAVESFEGEHGTITICTERTTSLPDATAPELPVRSETPGDYVRLRVIDSGCGMDVETRARIFDPFFTTKFTGRGLGLATVLGVVRAHHGALNVDSAPGKGTTVDIWFPVAESKAAVAVPKTPEPSPSHVSGTVLVVDDDPRVRDVAQQMLERTGFTVLTAQDGRDGLHTFEQHPEIAAVLLDLTMPVMDGREALRLLKRLAPNLPVILMSGYDERETTDMVGEGQGIAFLQKPFARQTLTQTIGQVLPIPQPLNE